MDSKNHPRFSVVIPAFNEAHYIADTLDSLAKQTFTDFEVIVVDNNSKDQTATIARSLGAKVVKEKHPGICWARQAGAETATGEIIVQTDADTHFKSDWLARINKTFEKSSKIVAVAGPCRYTNGPLWAELYPFFLFTPFSVAYRLLGQTYYASGTNISFYKSAWHGYDTAISQGGDELDLLRNLRKEGRVAFANDNPTYTSSRRQVRGFLYNFFITFWIYYILEYNLARIFKRPVLGTSPTFRNEISPKTLSFINFVLYLGVIILLLFNTGWGRHLIKNANHVVRNTERNLRQRL